MSDYIERSHEGEFFNPVSGTVPVNSDRSSGSGQLTNNDENLGRWKWLIDKWDKMSFKERMALFMPYLHYVNPRDKFKKEFDENFQKEMVETSYKLCRNFLFFKFDPDGQGIPNLIMVFDAIDPRLIPDDEIRSAVIHWGMRYGFFNCDCCCDCD